MFAVLRMNARALLRSAAVAALILAPLSARAAVVSPEVQARARSGQARIPVVLSLRTGAVRPGFSVTRRLVNAPVVAGWATAADIAALAARPDVLHVGLDRLVRPAGQIGTAQMGADRLLGLGVTGRGRSVAIVDSGIDLAHPDLKPPSSSGWPGWNFADNSGDLADCNGHGTEVAGVVAGPQGVAPEAGLVVLKVFSLNDGCRSARASDVLAAVDWAVTNREAWNIDAVNLSLADDSLHRAFCDADDPAGAATFAAVRAAGLAAVAASGNDGKSSGLPWPACLSNVAAVGMVYSASSGAVAWNGPPSCEDALSGPDVVPCASSSGPGLSMLAPGVGWTTTAAGGGRTAIFSGTSASAPAATGAVLLTRQTRPLADPALAFDLLRATGVPVLDNRTGRITPRLDLSAALNATTPIGSCGGAAIPDGSGELVCEAAISALTGRVSSVAVALSIEHPDVTQLIVSLSGPDGASIQLMSRSGRPGDALREVFGRTRDSLEPLSSFAGRPAAGTWRLRVLDVVPGAGSGRLVSWALLVEPEAPSAETPFSGATAVIPTSAHTIGRLGAFFTTDLRLFNADPANPQAVSVRFQPADAGPARTVSLTLPPLSARALDDVLGNTFRAVGYGPLFLSGPASVVASSRTATTAVRGGSFGLSIPASPRTAAAGSGAPLTLVPVFRSTGFRVNVGLTEVTGQDAPVEIVVKDAHGAVRAVLPETVPAGGLRQVNDIYATANLLPDAADRFEIRVVSGAGRVIPFATPVDDSSNDGAFSGASLADTDVLLPAVARADGRFGARYVTDLKIANAGVSPARVKASFFPTSGGAFSPVLVTLAGGETRFLDDALGQLFSPTTDVSGALRLTALDGAAIFASSRTYTLDGARSYGVAVDPVSGAGAAGPGRTLALTFLSGSALSRTNVGFVETAGAPTSLRVSLLTSSGVAVAARSLALGPNEAIQWNDVFAEMSTSPLEQASLLIDVLDGGSATAWATLIDNRTNDGSYFPATLVP
ncbi:MAG TPA: S8 family serine peptidase [Thermoanaerobaculia bacterium]|nr:S8 family serine peptidase [Thermoanaerobaculia bacterium]